MRAFHIRYCIINFEIKCQEIGSIVFIYVIRPAKTKYDRSYAP